MEDEDVSCEVVYDHYVLHQAEFVRVCSLGSDCKDCLGHEKCDVHE
jgi:hypothetical protein